MLLLPRIIPPLSALGILRYIRLSLDVCEGLGNCPVAQGSEFPPSATCTQYWLVVCQAG